MLLTSRITRVMKIDRDLITVFDDRYRPVCWAQWQKSSYETTCSKIPYCRISVAAARGRLLWRYVTGEHGVN